LTHPAFENFHHREKDMTDLLLTDGAGGFLPDGALGLGCLAAIIGSTPMTTRHHGLLDAIKVAIDQLINDKSASEADHW
jgi:hypothetical protein